MGRGHRASTLIVIKSILVFLSILSLSPKYLNKIADDLLIAADKYLVNELKEICIESLKKNLNKENFFKSLIIADKIMRAEKLFDLIVIGRVRI